MGLSETLVAELDFRLLPLMSAALKGPESQFALRVLGKLWERESLRPDFDPVWPASGRWVDDRDRALACPATVLATRARRHVPALLGSLERALAEGLDEGCSSYDSQVEVENLCWDIAELVRGSHDAIVLHVRRALPSAVFWSELAATSGR